MFMCPECLAEFGARVAFNEAVGQLAHRATKHYPQYTALVGFAAVVLGSWLWNQLTDS